MRLNKRLFEKYSEIIDTELAKRREKWTLTSIPSIGFEDVEQIIRTHIYLKIHLYDPNKSAFPHWCNAVISNQIRNLIRNNYGNYSRPCKTCILAESDEGCELYGRQCKKCPLFAKWEKYKKNAHDIKLALPIDNHSNEVFNIKGQNIDIEETAKNIHERMKSLLNLHEFKVYTLLFIKNLTEEQVAKTMKYKTNEAGRKAGYRILNAIKKNILVKVKNLLSSGEIDIISN